MSVIKLVANDSLPSLLLQLTDAATGVAIDLSGKTVKVKFRAQGSATTLFEATCTTVDAAAGQVRMDWPTDGLDVDEGRYEGEVAIWEGDDVQTVYELLKFRVREDMADV